MMIFVRSLPSSVRQPFRSPTTLPRFSSLPKPVLESTEGDGAGAGVLGRIGVRLTHRGNTGELLVGGD